MRWLCCGSVEYTGLLDKDGLLHLDRDVATSLEVDEG